MSSVVAPTSATNDKFEALLWQVAKGLKTKTYSYSRQLQCMFYELGVIERPSRLDETVLNIFALIMLCFPTAVLPQTFTKNGDIMGREQVLYI